MNSCCPAFELGISALEFGTYLGFRILDLELALEVARLVRSAFSSLRSDEGGGASLRKPMQEEAGQ